MSEDFDSYPAFEIIPNKTRGVQEGSDDLSQDFSFGPCWSVSAFGVCIEKWQNDKLTLGFYLSGIKIGQKTIDAKNPCVKLREGGDLAKVKADICADFSNRRVTAKGEVCVTFVCARFNQTIFNW